MSMLPRLLAPISVAVALAAAAPAAQADSSVAFPPLPDPPVTTVQITDQGPEFDTVHLTVTAAVPADLVDTKVFLGSDYWAPYTAIGVDGVRDARYAGEDDFVDGELSTETCAVYDSSLLYDSAPVVVAGDGASFSADLPKGEIIAFEDTRVAVGIVGDDTGCESFGFHGLEIDYVDSRQTIDGFSWADPAAPVITHVAGGRREVALSFDQAPGTQYDIYRVGDAVPFAANLRGDGDAVQVVLTEDADGARLTPGTEYAFQVKATRLFNVWNDDRTDMFQPTSPLSAVAAATTAAVQTLQFTATPAASTTESSARFSWSINANDAGEAPWCGLDLTETSGTELPCSATGASIDGLAVGPHTLTVYPPDGEGVYSYAWTVTAVPAALRPPRRAARRGAGDRPDRPGRRRHQEHVARQRQACCGAGHPEGSRPRRQRQAHARNGPQGRQEDPRVPRRRRWPLQARQDARAEDRRVHRQEREARPHVQLQDGRRQRRGSAGQGLQEGAGRGPQVALTACDRH